MPDSNATDACPSIASMVAHLVNQLLWPESGGERAMNGGCGRSSCAWLASYDRAGVWRRIRSGYCQLTLEGHGEIFLEAWSRWGIVVDGVYGVPVRWARRTAASVSSSSAIEMRALWPTPRAEKIEGMASEGYSPTLHQLVQRWPSPKASNANGAGLHGSGS